MNMGMTSFDNLAKLRSGVKSRRWTSTAYWYQIGRTQPLPDVGTFEDRVPYGFGGLERWPGKNRNELPR